MPFATSSPDPNMTPEMATAKLGELAAAYQGPAPDAGSPAAARAELAAKLNDPQFYTKFANSSSEARAQFNDLLARGKADAADLIIAGKADTRFEVTTGGEVSKRDQMTAAAGLLEAGIKPDQVKRLLNNEPLSRADYETVLNVEREKLGDPEFVKRWLEGGAEEKRVMALVGIYKTVGFKDAA